MVFKWGEGRYKTKNGKLYLNYIYLGGESEEQSKQIFPSGKVNTKEAKKYIELNYPEVIDYILERSLNWEWYEAFIEKSNYDKILGKDVDTRSNRINSLSRSKII